MDSDRRFGGRLKDESAYPLAAVVVLALATVIYLGLAPGDELAVVPDASPLTPLSSATTPPMATSKPRIAVAPRPTLSPSQFAGLIRLPPEGAEPSTPEVGELIGSYVVAGGGLPYRGTARLYADGRLIWNRYYSGPEGPNHMTTGYLEQRLTPETVDFVNLETYLPRKDPLWLHDHLPLDAWEVRMPIPYVPSGYGICLHAMDPRPGRAIDGISLEPAQLIAMLPTSISSLLGGREFVSPIDWAQDCVAQTMDEVRVLDRVLSEAAFAKEPFINQFMVQYSVDVPGAYGMEISLMFEPRFPDGSIGCSACG